MRLKLTDSNLSAEATISFQMEIKWARRLWGGQSEKAEEVRDIQEPCVLLSVMQGGAPLGQALSQRSWGLQQQRGPVPIFKELKSRQGGRRHGKISEREGESSWCHYRVQRGFRRAPPLGTSEVYWTSNPLSFF